MIIAYTAKNYMALHFHPLTIKKLQRETPDAVCISFDIPEDLKNEFAFKQGQNITLKKVINGEEIRRSYSICSSPLDNELTVGIKKAFNGLFSIYANTQLNSGDVLQVLPPSGRFYTELNPLHKKRYVAFAAGSGITPVLSIIKTTLATEPQSSFTLVYGNKNRSSIMFKNELGNLKDKYIQRFSLHHILSREKVEPPLNYGRIDDEKCAALKNLLQINKADEFFLCGPEEMIFSIKKFLENEGVDKRKIHLELFNTPAKKRTVVNYHTIKEIHKGSRVTVKLDGRSFDFSLEYNGNTILDAALAEGADLPFACKGGVCTTCKAKLLEGKVDMDVNYGLEPDEVKAGFILTCQSHPLSEIVVIDYDIK